VQNLKKKALFGGSNWLVFLSCAIFCVVLSYHLRVFDNGFSNSDEPSHFVNSYFIAEYLSRAAFSHPMGFARDFYIAYPKLSIGHWPPLYYGLVGGLFLVLPALPETAVWINILVTALAACLTALLLRPHASPGWCLLTALLFLCLPTTVTGLNFFMLDQPLTVMVLLAALAWQRFARQPGYGAALLYGGIAAAAILIKGNGWLLGLFPLLHLGFTGRWRLLADPRSYAGAFFCLLLVVPWYALTAGVSADGFNYAPGLDYALLALGENLATLYENLGPIGLALGLLTLLRCWPGETRQDPRAGLVPTALAMVVAVLLLQSLVPVDITARYMMPAMPFALLLAVLGLLELRNLAALRPRVVAPGAVQAVAALLILAPGLWHIATARPQSDLRMADAAAMVVDTQQPQVVIIDGSPAGEGAFIAEALVRSRGMNLHVVRSSKLFSSSNFMGSDYQVLLRTPVEIAGVLEALGVGLIVLERREGGNIFAHSDLLEEYLLTPGSGYTKMATLAHRWRPGSTHVYASERQRQANLQEVRRINLPDKGDFL